MSFDINNLVRKNIQTMKPIHRQGMSLRILIRRNDFLDANENPFENGVNRYPDPQQKTVKSALAELKKVNQNQILLGNGSDEVLDLLFRAFCEPNRDNVITLPPTYGMYGVLANLNAVENREVVLNNNFQPDVTSILEAVDQNSKMIFLCSPNNPTGNTFAEETISNLLEKFKGLVVLDEAYIDFSDKESWLQKIDKYPNLVITQTLSKAYGMAGIRLGILYASAPIIAVLNKIKPPYNVNELTQQKALTRILDTISIQYEIHCIKEERDKLLQQLQHIQYVEKIYPTEANFVLIKVDDATKRYNQLIEKGIVIRNRTTQALCENTLRLTIGTAKENLKLIESLTLLGL
ncbi:MAG: histidinol-phosphate transaminase [Flavobacterium sp.]|nr:histidinol-phosphate transaminase [Flavobacterium sp.]